MASQIKSNLAQVIKGLDTTSTNMKAARDRALQELVKQSFQKSADLIETGKHMDGRKYTGSPGADIASRTTYPRPGGGKSKPYYGKPVFNSKKVVERTGDYHAAIKGAAQGDRTDFDVRIRDGKAEVHVIGPQADKILSLERKATPKGRARATLRKGLNSVWGAYSKLFKKAFSK